MPRFAGDLSQVMLLWLHKLSIKYAAGTMQTTDDLPAWWRSHLNRALVTGSCMLPPSVAIGCSITTAMHCALPVIHNFLPRRLSIRVVDDVSRLLKALRSPHSPGPAVLQLGGVCACAA